MPGVPVRVAVAVHASSRLLARLALPRATAALIPGCRFFAVGAAPPLPPPPSVPPPGPSEGRRDWQSSGAEQLQQGGQQQNRAGYNAVLQSLGEKPNSGAKAEEWLEQMVESNVEATVQSYNHVFKAWAREGKFAEVEALLAKMKERQVLPNVVSYTNLVLSYTRAGDTDSALQVLDRMRADNVSPNFVTYTVLIDAFGKKDDIARAEALLTELESCADLEGAQPLASPYSCVMHAQVRAGNTQASEKTWDRMLQRGIKPDTVGYTTFIQLCTSSGDTDRALKSFEEMVSAGVRPNGTTFAVLISALAKDAKVLACQDLWTRMEALQVKPSVPCYNGMIQVHAKAGLTDLAETWMAKLNTIGRPNAHSFGALMDAFAKHGQHTKCSELMQHMQSQGIQENRVHHNTIIKAYINAGDIDGAEQSLAAMGKTPATEPDFYSYNTLFFGMLRAGSLDRAGELLQRMRGRSMEPDEQLLRALALARDRLQAAQPLSPELSAPGAAAGLEGVDWVEEVAADGSKLFRDVRTGVRQPESPTTGIVQLMSESGPYYWNVASNTTSWEHPGRASA